jgi:nitrile hydratase accessory protein
MSAAAPAVPVVELEGAAAPPRSNGELIFAEPWESRAFGLAVALHSSGTFTWKTFSTELAARIAGWERDHPPGECYSYYSCCLEALEAILERSQIVDYAALADRANRLRQRPEGHDHRHA